MYFLIREVGPCCRHFRPVFAVILTFTGLKWPSLDSTSICHPSPLKNPAALLVGMGLAHADSMMSYAVSQYGFYSPSKKMDQQLTETSSLTSHSATGTMRTFIARQEIRLFRDENVYFYTKRHKAK